MTLRVHHLGIAVKDIAATAAHYVQCFGYEVKSEIIRDPAQTAYVQFLQLPGDPIYVELVSPDRPDSRLSNALNKGGGLNHVCYATEDIEAEFHRLRSLGLFLLQQPVAAAAFRGRHIAWLMGRDQVPIELVEKGSPGEGLFVG
jgi:methylmalonyl-CoA/ethylmalonyl-CoA epimerase